MIRLALLLAPLTVAGAEPLIHVDGIALTGEAISRRAVALRAAGRIYTGEQLADALVDEAVLAADARRTGLDRDPSVRASMDQEGARVLAEAFARGPLTAAVQPTEADLLAVYHQSTDTVRLELVAVATEEEAKAVKARLTSGGEFALEAARSLDRSARNKGDTGTMSRMQMSPSLAKEAFEAPIGALFGPVPLDAGFAVARVVERKIADEAGFKDRRAGLQSYVQQQGLAGAKRHYAEAMRKKHSASLDTAFLESLGRRIDATPTEMDHPFATVGGEKVPYRVLFPRIRAMGGGHLQGPATKTQLAWTVVDERLLAKAAREAGLAAKPETVIDLAAAENQALAVAMAERIRATAPQKAGAKEREEAIRTRIKALRKELSVKVDRKAAVAAAETAR